MFIFIFILYSNVARFQTKLTDVKSGNWVIKHKTLLWKTHIMSHVHIIICDETSLKVLKMSNLLHVVSAQVGPLVQALHSSIMIKMQMRLIREGAKMPFKSSWSRCMMKRGLVSNSETCGLVDKCKFPLENCKHHRAHKEGRKPLEDQNQSQGSRWSGWEC